ncbi:MAG: hypothetical protein J5781_03870 [Clostridia bacterium]|nr:hypothetical protein [Clostridia bacterium]
MKEKSTKKIFYAVIMLLIAALLVGTTTYAWFSMNKTVTVTGMVVKVRATDNIMIAEDNDEDDFEFSLDQVRSGNLRPASTIDGVNYFYPLASNVGPTGSTRTDAYEVYSEAAEAGTPAPNKALNTHAGKANHDTAFNANYDVTVIDADNEAYAYIDYSFYLKATNAADFSQDVVLSKCNLIYDNGSYDFAAQGATKAWRIALFSYETAAETEVSDATVATLSNLKIILSPANANYFNAGKAADSISSRDDVIKLGNAGSATVGTVEKEDTAYFKVVVRLWLEGEDNTCKVDTFAGLTDDWALDLAFSFGDEPDAVTAIGSVANTSLTVMGNILEATLLSADETAVRYDWYEVGEPTVIDTTASGINAMLFNGRYYCVIVTDQGTKYKTKSVTVHPDIMLFRAYPYVFVETSDVIAGAEDVRYQWYELSIDGNTINGYAAIEGSNASFAGHDQDTLQVLDATTHMVFCVVTTGTGANERAYVSHLTALSQSGTDLSVTVNTNSRNKCTVTVPNELLSGGTPTYEWHYVNSTSHDSPAILAGNTDFSGYDTDTLTLLTGSPYYVYCVVDAGEYHTSVAVRLLPAAEVTVDATRKNVVSVLYWGDEPNVSYTWYKVVNNSNVEINGNDADFTGSTDSDTLEFLGDTPCTVFCRFTTDYGTYFSDKAELLPTPVLASLDSNDEGASVTWKNGTEPAGCGYHWVSTDGELNINLFTGIDSAHLEMTDYAIADVYCIVTVGTETYYTNTAHVVKSTW